MPAALPLLALLLLTAPAQGQAPPEAATSNDRGAYITVNVGIEVQALERAARDAARATEELAAAVRALATLPSLSDAQRAELMTVLGRVDTLSSRVAGAIDRLPDAVRETREPLAAIATDLAGQVRRTIIGVVVLLLALLLGGLAGFYVLVLRPGRRLLAGLGGGMQTMKHSLERAAERAAEIIAEANALHLARALEAIRAAPVASTVASTTPAADP